MRKAWIAAAAISLVAASGASAQGYDETQNWLGAYGQTQKDWSDPEETAGVVALSAENLSRSLQEPDKLASRNPVYQHHTWPFAGDPDRATWAGQKIPLEFACPSGIKLDGTVWAPSAAMLAASGFSAPLPGVVINEGFMGTQPMYYWAAQGLAEAGYMVLTFDTPGQGSSQSGNCGEAALKTAVDFFTSNQNPLRSQLDVNRIGTAGHSAGASAVQSLGDYGGRVKAISAWSDLGSSYAGNAPIQGQGADYESWILPPTPNPATSSEGKLGGYNAQKARGIDTQEIVIESGSHLAWSHVTWSYTSTWSEEIALHYALAWFDRYLAADHVRGGKSATARLKENHESVESPGHGLSKKYASAYHLDGVECRNMVAGC